MTGVNKVNSEDIKIIFKNNFAKLNEQFVIHQSAFMAGVYKRYFNDLEMGNIVLCFAKTFLATSAPVVCVEDCFSAYSSFFLMNLFCTVIVIIAINTKAIKNPINIQVVVLMFLSLYLCLK